MIHDVPAFEIELEDGTRRHVEVGEDPVVENIELLAKPAVAAGAAVELLVPMNSGANESVALLSGRVRVAGMVVDGERYKSPPGASAVLTILDPT